MPGPLPKPDGERLRRNAPVIPTTRLPVSGRVGETPKIPAGKSLAKAGKAWWTWAWSTPQAAAWDAGALHFVFRRAELEDDLALLDGLDGNRLDLSALLGIGERTELVRELKFIIRHLQALAGGKLALERQMTELDDRLGLNPKALAQLRWTIVPDVVTDETGEPEDDEVTRRRQEREKRTANG